MKRFVGTRGFSTKSMNVFDRELKARQRVWAIQRPDADYYDYLRKEAADRLVDRLEDISRSFPSALELGCHNGHIANLLDSKQGLSGTGGIGGVQKLIQCDSFPTQTSQVLKREFIETDYLAVDEENIPFEDKQFDLVLSSLALHWVNNLPATLTKIKNILKPDGAFVGAMLGGSTLQELKQCLYLAELERKGGMSPHASPFALPSDVAGLMQGAGFALPTVDVDTITIGYPDMFSLMEHISRMGEGSCTLQRQYSVGSDTFLAAAALYKELYGMEDGSIPATFQIIYMIGWSPHDSQPKACRRGSGQASLKTTLGQPQPQSQSQSSPASVHVTHSSNKTLQ